MDRKKVFVCAVFAALVVSFAFAASAQEEDTTEQVDWNDAANYAELMDTFTNSSDVEMATYYVEGQNVLWSQPASMSVEDATAELAKDPEGAGLDSISQWVVPTSLWLCDNNKSSDTTCTSGTNYKWGGGDFSLDHVSGLYAYYVADSLDCSYESIERIRSMGSSNVADYCHGDDGDYRGYYSAVGGGWSSPVDDDWCGHITTYFYGIDDSSHITNRTYDGTSGENVVRFRFWVTAENLYYYTVVSIGTCLR
jgi:hypothetical protein